MVKLRSACKGTCDVHKDVDRVGNLLDKRAESRDPVDRVLLSATLSTWAYLDLLHDVVTELQDLPHGLVEFLRGHGVGVGTAWLTCAHVLDVGHVAREGSIRVGARELEEQGTEGGIACGGVPGCVTDSLVQVGHGRLGQVVAGFTHERVDKVVATKSAGNKDGHVLAVGCANADVAAHVREDGIVAEGDESLGQLGRRQRLT